jgi:hypothetical protein
MPSGNVDINCTGYQIRESAFGFAKRSDPNYNFWKARADRGKPFQCMVHWIYGNPPLRDCT